MFVLLQEKKVYNVIVQYITSTICIVIFTRMVFCNFWIKEINLFYFYSILYSM
jgi:hypothetical protein